MAQFTINHTGLPSLLANDAAFIIEPDNGGLDNLTEDYFMNVLQFCDLGAQPTIISNVTPAAFFMGTLEISEDGSFVILRAPWLDLDDLDPAERYNTFDFTIKDAFDRESTSTGSILITTV